MGSEDNKIIVGEEGLQRKEKKPGLNPAGRQCVAALCASLLGSSQQAKLRKTWPLE